MASTVGSSAAVPFQRAAAVPFWRAAVPFWRAAAVPFWRAAGMTYISYSNIYANLVRNCLKEPFKSEDLTHEKVHFSISKWDNGVPQKPSNPLSLSIVGFFFNFFLSIRLVAEKICEEKDEELKHKLIVASFCLFH